MLQFKEAATLQSGSGTGLLSTKLARQAQTTPAAGGAAAATRKLEDSDIDELLDEELWRAHQGRRSEGAGSQQKAGAGTHLQK